MIRVLVVDDDVRVARDHQKLVDGIDGFRVVGVAHDAANALGLVDRVLPDLVLLDVRLPDDSGMSVLRHLRDATRMLDVLVVTAERKIDTVRTAIRSGVVHYLLKPFEPGALRHRLERYAAAKRTLDVFTAPEQSDVDKIYSLLRAEAD